ncbi:MAG: response regulator transcription factor [Mariniphaga sp.]|nr:response regulator transcription factor [Mariniphaga sp.]
MSLNQSYKTVIIDDELPARLRLKQLASEYPGIFEIVGEAENGEQAVEIITRLKPGLIFLDIKMPGLDGFEVLKQIPYMPIVIFCTAFDEYALQAFDSFCADYLVKPLTKERFSQSVEKLKQFNGQISNTNIYKLIEKLSSDKKYEEVTSIPVKVGDRIIFVRLDEVSYLKANEKHISIVTKHAKTYILDSSLKKLEEKLPDCFIRVHKSFIINKNLLKEVRKHFNNRFVLIMDDYEQSRITSGRSYYEGIKALFEL